MSRPVVTDKLRAAATALAPEATRKWTAFSKALRDHFGVAFTRALKIGDALKSGDRDPQAHADFVEKLLGPEGWDKHRARALDRARVAERAAITPGDRERNPASNDGKPGLSQTLKTSFSKSPHEYTFEPANEVRPQILEIARVHGVELVRPIAESGSDSHLLGDDARRIGAIFGGEILFFKGSAERGQLGFTPRGSPELIFLSTDHEAGDVPFSMPLAHEMLHVAQKDVAAGAVELGQKINGLLSEDERGSIQRALTRLGYQSESFPTEIPAFFAGEAIGDFPMLLREIKEAPEIRRLIHEYFDGMGRLKPSGLAEVADDELSRHGAEKAQVPNPDSEGEPTSTHRDSAEPGKQFSNDKTSDNISPRGNERRDQTQGRDRASNEPGKPRLSEEGGRGGEGASENLGSEIARGKGTTRGQSIGSGRESIVFPFGERRVLKEIRPGGVLAYRPDGRVAPTNDFGALQMKAKIVNALGGMPTEAVKTPDGMYLVQEKGFPITYGDYLNVRLPFNIDPSSGYEYHVEIEGKQYLISDLHQGNFLKDALGSVRVVDLITGRIGGGD